MSREAFSPDIYTYANTNNFGSRFFYPGRFDNEVRFNSILIRFNSTLIRHLSDLIRQSLLAFDW